MNKAYLIVTKNDCPDCDDLKRQIGNVKFDFPVDWLNLDEEPKKFEMLMSEIDTPPRGVPFMASLIDDCCPDPHLEAVKAAPIMEKLFESNS